MTLTGLVPARLTSGEPGWTTGADVVVIGSGIAAALGANFDHSPAGVLSLTRERAAVHSCGATLEASGGLTLEHAATTPEELP